MAKPKEKPRPEAVEQKQYMVFNPDNIKQVVEVPVKPRPTAEQLETVEYVGTKAKDVKRRVKKDPASTTTSKTKTIKKYFFHFSIFMRLR